MDAPAVIDVSLPVSPATAVYPGDPGVRLHRFATRSVAGFNATELHMCAHAGTHIDAPRHLFDAGADAASLSLADLVGPAHVIDCTAAPVVQRQHLVAQVRDHDRRVLLKTGGGRNLRQGGAGCGHLTPEAAAWLAGGSIRLVGIESLSVDAPGVTQLPAHAHLLEASVVIVEGLDLTAVRPGDYELLCLPLPLVGCDGAPARVALRS